MARVKPATLIGEPGARRVSPFLFLLAIIGFFLVFTGVSCNTDATKSALRSLGGSAGITSAQSAALNSCLNSLKGVDFVTYNGWALVFGKDPTVESLPASCEVSTGPVTQADAAQANVGPQLLAILGLVSAGLAMLTGLAAFLRDTAGRSRAMVAVVFGAGSGVLLVLDQLHVHDIVLNKIAASAGSSVPGFSPSAYFNVNPGIGLLVVLAILAVAVLYNLTALVVGAGPVAVPLPEPQPPPSPP